MSVDPLLGKQLLGRYRIVQHIGSGGMSRVYLGEQALGTTTRPVAIKVLDRRSSTDPNLAERFRRESETIVRLRHPNTVEIYDVGELADGTLFFVMEHIEGESLSDLVKRGPVPLPKVDKILLQICGSVHDAHQNGVVHRDLKPANVLLTRRGVQEDFVKVLDFGVAKADWDGKNLTGDDRLLGTPAYMSPEQFKNAKVDARSDVYAIGVITYLMVTGNLPFRAKSPWDWAAKHVQEPPEPMGPGADGNPIPEGRQQCILRALSKDPAQRQATMLEFLREFATLKDVTSAWSKATSGPPTGDTSLSALRPEELSLGALQLADMSLDVPKAPPPPPPPAARRKGAPPPPPPPRARESNRPTAAAASALDPSTGGPAGVAYSGLQDLPNQSVALGGASVGQYNSLDAVSAAGRDDYGASEMYQPPMGAGEGIPLDIPAVSISSRPEPMRGGAQPAALSLDMPSATNQALSMNLNRATHPDAVRHRQGSRRSGLSQGTLKAIRGAGVLLIVCVAAIVVFKLTRGEREDARPEAVVEEDPVVAEAESATDEPVSNDLGSSLLAGARKSLKEGHFESAVIGVETVWDMEEYNQGLMDAVRNEVSKSAGKEIRRIIRRGRCEDAQATYLKLVKIDAAGRAADQFDHKCRLPK